jgi:hypothetical protein
MSTLAERQQLGRGFHVVRNGKLIHSKPAVSKEEREQIKKKRQQKVVDGLLDPICLVMGAPNLDALERQAEEMFATLDDDHADANNVTDIRAEFDAAGGERGLGCTFAEYRRTCEIDANGGFPALHDGPACGSTETVDTSADATYRAEFLAGGGEARLGVTERDYIRSRRRDAAGGFVS